jgi:chromosome segregation and condensation protein ScpB
MSAERVPVLRLARGLELPLQIVTQRVGILGMPGTGKTSTGVVLVEQLRKAGVQVVVIDPSGAWWGVAHSKDGQGPGVEMVVLGGEHGVAPLSRDAGKACARLVAEEHLSCVLDIDRPYFTSWAARTHFVADFLGDLYELCRSRIVVVIDEAHRFAPQGVREEGGESARSLGAVSDVVALGRRRGLDAILITQRAAKLNKDVLELCQILIAHQLRGNNDRAQLKGWLDNAGGELKDILAGVGKLDRGHAYVSAPSYGIDAEYKILPKTTFDSSADAASSDVLEAGVSSVDVAAIEKLLADTIEKTNAEDPRVLHKRIRELEKQAAAGMDAGETAHDNEVLQAERSLTQSELDDIAEILGLPKDGDHGAARDQVRELVTLRDFVAPRLLDVSGLIRPLVTQAADVQAAIDELRADVRDFERDGIPPAETARPVDAASAADQPSAVFTPPSGTGEAAARPGTGRAEQNGDQPHLKAGAKRMLEALYDAPRPLTRKELSTVAKVAMGGTISEYVGALRDAELIDERDGTVALTVEGRVALVALGALASERPPRRRSAKEIAGQYHGNLKAGAIRMLDLLMRARKRGYTRKELSGAAGVAMGGTISEYIGALRKRGLLEEHNRRCYPGPALYIWEDE